MVLPYYSTSRAKTLFENEKKPALSRRLCLQSGTSKNDVLINHMNRFFANLDGLIDHDEVISMHQYIQHGKISCLSHSLYVAYSSFRACEILKLDARSAARGAMLHDFFLYDWHVPGYSEGLHGFSHPRVAHQNAKKHFTLNAIEEEIILKHMFPLTLSPPKKREAIVVTLVDKWCTVRETLHLENRKICDLTLKIALNQK